MANLQGFDLIPGQLYVLDYTNHLDIRADREVEFVKFVWGTDKFHPKPQFLLVAKAKDRNNELRNFAVSSVHSTRLKAAETQPKPSLREILLARLKQFNSELEKEEHANVKAAIEDARTTILFTAPEAMDADLWLRMAGRVHMAINLNHTALIARWKEIMNAPVHL